MHRPYPPGAERSYVHAYKLLSRIGQVLQKKCMQSLRNPAGREWVQDDFLGECVWAEPGRMGRILTGHERRGNSKWKTSSKGRFHCLTPESSPPLLGHSSTVSVVCSIAFLLLSLHHCWRVLGMFLVDGINPASSFPSLPLVCVSAVQWKLVKFNLEENNMNKNTFLSVGRIVIYAQVRLFPLT